MRKGRVLTHNFIFIFAFIILNALSVFAGPGKTTYQAKIVKPDGYPLEVSSVNFKFTILDPAGSCVLYSETYSSVNMSSTGGLISFALGSGVKTYPVSATTFEQVFSNIAPSLSCDTGGPVSYSPSANDIRKIVMQFHDGSGWQTLPAMSINAVPYAMYANEATKLNGLTSSDFVQVSTVPTCTASEALRYTGTGFNCIAVGNSVTSGTVITALGYTPADSVSLTTVTSNVSSVSSTVFSVSSTVTSLQNSVAVSFAAITSSQWTTSGTNIFYNTGNIGVGTTTPVTKLDVSGGVRIGLESTTCAPALAGTLRYNASNVEYCNGTSWQAFGVSGSGITNINGSTSGTQSLATGTGGTAPNIATANGVHTFNIPNASTGSVTGGLISNADYTTFTNKITSSAASIAQVLGYVPADNAASGTYAQKANNLSDLTNIATARTNLGLGTFATANTLDLGSASATGTLAITRLPNFTGDATIAAASNTIILSNSGVTAGTYTKVTVDSKGRVTSSSALASSDVTTALGYTPADAASATQWTTSGTNIYYNAGNVGVGTANSTAAKLVVSGSALIGTASMNYSGSASAAILTAGSPIIFDGGSSSIARLIWSGGTLSFGKCQDTTCGPMSPYLDINTTSNITTFYNMNSVRAGNGYGTATAPTFSFGGNTNIGMFNPGSGILSFSTSGAERVRLTSVGTFGIGTTTPVTKLDVSGGVRISMESATCAASFAGTLRYNTGNVEYCNGTSWQAFGVSGAGLQSLNGSTSGTQSLATGTGGTAPNFNTSNGVHTLNIPLATTGSVTAGLLSNADYTTFSNKITSSAASIAQVLGYVPADNAASGTYAQKANNLSDLTNIATARTNLGLGTFATANTLDLGSASATGTLAIARLPSFTGDATIAAASNTIILSNSGVTAGTYTKVTVDSKGRVTSSSALASSDVTTALGYTPANSATTVSSQWATSGTTINYMTGNVGIGMSAPTSPLDVAVTDTSSGVMLTNTNSTVSRYPIIGVVNYAGSTTGHPVLSMSNALGTSDAPTAINSGMNLGTLLWTGRITASQTMQGARIDAIAEANFGVNTAPTRLTFSVAPSSGNYVQRMVINSTGNVGIGITTPTAKLHLPAGTSSTAPLKFTSGTLLTSAESGTMEYDGFNFYVTDSTNTRRTIATGSSVGTIDNASNINSSGNITMTPTGSVVVSSTTASTNSSTGALIVKGGVGVAGNLNVAGTISGSAKVIATGFRANQGVPDAADSSTNGYAFGQDGDTGLFSPGSGSTNGVLAFYSNNSEKMRITSGGSVGIGTSSPTSLMEIYSNSGYMKLTGASVKKRIIMGNQDSGGVNNPAIIESANGFLAFGGGNSWSADDGGTMDYTMMLADNGSVGIGTTSPSRKLEVSGTVAVSDKLWAGYGNNNILGYSWTDSALTTNSIEIVNNNAAVSGSSPTLAFHRYGTGGPQFRLDATGTNVLYLESSGLNAARNPNAYGGNSNSFFSRLHIDGGLSTVGNVGIGVSAPATTLEVSGTAMLSAGSDGANSFTTHTKIARSSMVMGTPSSVNATAESVVGSLGFLGYSQSHGQLAYIASSSNGRFEFKNVSAGGPSLNISDVNTYPYANVFLGRLGFGTSNTVTMLSNTSVNHGDSSGIGGHTSRSISWEASNQGYVAALANTDATSAARNGLLVKTAATDTGSYIARFESGGTNKMTVRSDGNVGIGTINPTAKLEVSGDIALAASATESAYHTGLQRLPNGTSILWFGGGTGNLQIKAGATGTAGDRMTITASGNVGIGSATPTAKLEVSRNFNGESNTTAGFIGGIDAGYTNTGAYFVQKDSLSLGSAGTNLFNVVKNGVSQFSVNGAGDTFIGVDKAAGNIGYGNPLWFKGTEPSTDNMWMAKYVNSSDVSYLRVNIGDETSDYFVVGRSSDGTTAGTWTNSFWVKTDGSGWIAGTLTQASDGRLKKNIRPLDNSLEKVLRLEGVTYNWIDPRKPASMQMGLIAQDVEKVYPEVVANNEDGYKSVAYQNLVAPMINAIKELHAKIVTLFDRTDQQSRQIANLEAENAKLKENDKAKDKKIKELEERMLRIEKTLNQK